MKGIILGGGEGTRLKPLTSIISKHLLPIYDKPMIYYPLSTLMLAGIRDILIITAPRDLKSYQELLGDGRQWGITLRYEVQERANGIAEAINIARPLFECENVCLILGDNVYYGEGLPVVVSGAAKGVKGVTVFLYRVNDPERYGVAELDGSGRVLSIVEKPVEPKSNLAVTGIYFYHRDVFDLVKELLPSKRGELEVTDLNNLFLDLNRLEAIQFGRGQAWLDTGTAESLLEASQFISIIEKRQGVKIACLEEIALRLEFITKQEFDSLIDSKPVKNEYYDYLRKIQKYGLT